MIVDNIKNADKYYGLNERIKKALTFIKENKFEDMTDGKYEISGSDIFAVVSRYETKSAEKGVWESHIKYIDVQFVADGTEKMGYSPIENLKVTQEYSEEKDILFYTGDGDFFTAAKGTFTIFFPGDAHMPGLNPEGKSQNVLKVVVKVSVY